MSGRALHRWMGIGTVLAFVLTGAYLRMHAPPIADVDAGYRVLLRSGHIYLLFAGLINVAFGCGTDPLRPGRWPRLRRFASTAVLVAPPLLLLGFFLESDAAELERQLTRLGIYAAFGGVLLHLFASRGEVA